MNKTILERIADAIVSRAGVSLFGCAALAAIFAFQIPSLTADFTPSDLFASFGDQEEVAAEFRRTFGNTDNVILVLLQGDNVLDSDSLTSTVKLTRKLRELDDVVRVESLTGLPVRKGNAPVGKAVGESSSVTDAYFDLYEKTASLIPSEGEGESKGGEGPRSGTSAQNSQSRQSDTVFEYEPVISSLPVSKSDAERLRESIAQQQIVQGRMISSDHTVSAIAVFLDENRLRNDQISESIEGIERAIADVELPGGERAFLGGLPYIRKSVIDSLGEDQKVLLPAAIVVSLFILFLAFRWWAAMVLPTMAVGFSAVILVGAMALADEPLNILNNIVPTLVVVIGISDSIHVLSRYRDEIGRGLSRMQAAKSALHTMAIACFLTSFTTAVGFASLVVSRTDILKHFGITAAVGVMIAYVMTVVLLPSALSLVPAPSEESVQRDHGGFERYIEGMTRWVVRKRVYVVLAAAVFVGACVWSGSSINVDSAVLDQVNQNSQVYKATRLIERKLGGVRPLEFYLKAESDGRLLAPEVLEANEEFIQWAQKQTGVLGTLAYGDFIQQARQFATGQNYEAPLHDFAQNRALYRMLYEQEEHNPLSSYLVADGTKGRLTLTLKDMGAMSTNLLIDKAEVKIEQLYGSIEGVHLRITGDAYSSSRGLDAVIGDLLGSLATAIVIIFIFLTLLFRSIKLGLLSIPPNIIPLALTLGYMSIRGVPLNTTTAIIFSISIGLAVDGTIHYLARFREELSVDQNVEEALVRAARGTGKAIMVTCVALIVGFGVMLVSQFVPIRRFGELIAITVFGMLVSTIVVLPALIDIGYRATQFRGRD